MKSYTWSVSSGDIMANINSARELFIDDMERLEVITKEQAATMRDYSVIVVEKGFLGKCIDKLLNFSDGMPNVKVVKVRLHN